MSNYTSNRARTWRLFSALLAALVSTGAGIHDQVWGYTPQSPEVQQMVGAAINYLAENHQGQGVGYYSKLGGTCLAGIAAFKHTGNINHPLVQAAVAKCRSVIQDGNRLFQRPGLGDFNDSNYDIGIALIFLCELGPDTHRREIETMLNALLQRQQPGGAWSYAPSKKGDTSQTQYGVLGLWMAHRNNVTIPRDSVERVCNWLLRTQSRDGGFGYDPEDPGSFDRIAHPGVTVSRTAAGIGSAYICAELLGFVRGPETTQSRRVPAALREVGAAETRRGPVTNRVPGAQLQRTLRDGNEWFRRNYSVEFAYYQYYYLYALERYMSFREYAEGRNVAEPTWYNQGVELLRRAQKEDGSWSDSLAGPLVDTSFAVLFLLRSTQAALGNVEQSGRLQGGKSLPSDLSQIAVNDNGQIVSTKETPPVDDLLAMLEAAGPAEFDTGVPTTLSLANDPPARAAQVARLRRMAVSGSYQARLTAVSTLATDRDLDNVPALIYALSDPDPRVMRAARDGLRFISRKVSGFGLPRSATPEQQRAAQSKWREWFLSIRPTGVLIDG